jgi:hypothetical protein
MFSYPSLESTQIKTRYNVFKIIQNEMAQDSL